jgi:hypothetical protein
VHKWIGSYGFEEDDKTRLLCKENCDELVTFDCHALTGGEEARITHNDLHEQPLSAVDK